MDRNKFMVSLSLSDTKGEVINMAWMTDEAFCLFEDTRDKKSTAASSHKQRTHCGKGGRAKLPHEHLSRKELLKLNGEVMEYKMSEPIKWSDFKKMPDDLKVEYVKGLREKFGVPDKHIADMMGIGARQFALVMVDLKAPPTHKGRNKWDKKGFDDWKTGRCRYEFGSVTEVEEKTERESCEVNNCNDGAAGNIGRLYIPATELFSEAPGAPVSGELTFDNVLIDDIYGSVKALLGRSKAKIKIAWEVVGE